MKTSGIGGQAVMEGVMMRNGEKYAVAVRKPDNTIELKKDTYKSLTTKNGFFRLPIIRGVVAFVDSLVLGFSTLTYSSEVIEEDDDENYEPKGLEKFLIDVFKEKAADVVMTFVVMLSIMIAVGIFVLLPTFLASLLGGVIKSEFKRTFIEGLIRLVLFILYVWLISLMNDIKRTYMYHGAEHKCINCVEHGLDLTVENVRKSSRFHKRCGTSFLFIIVFISIILFMFIRTDVFALKILFRLLLIPVISGVSFEFLRLAGSKDNVFFDILSAPGLWLQRLTTSEPDDSMIEVAIASVEAVFDWQSFVAKVRREEAGMSDKDFEIGAQFEQDESADDGSFAAENGFDLDLEDVSGDVSDTNEFYENVENQLYEDVYNEETFAEEDFIEKVDNEEAYTEEQYSEEAYIENINVENENIENLYVENAEVENAEVENTDETVDAIELPAKSDSSKKSKLFGRKDKKATPKKKHIKEEDDFDMFIENNEINANEFENETAADDVDNSVTDISFDDNDRIENEISEDTEELEMSENFLDSTEEESEIEGNTRTAVEKVDDDIEEELDDLDKDFNLKASDNEAESKEENSNNSADTDENDNLDSFASDEIDDLDGYDSDDENFNDDSDDFDDDDSEGKGFKGFLGRFKSKKKPELSAEERIARHKTLSTYDEDYDESDELLKTLDMMFDNKDTKNVTDGECDNGDDVAGTDKAGKDND